MPNNRKSAIAIVGVGAIMPEARTLTEFWNNIKNGVYTIKDVPESRWDPNLYYDPDPKAPGKTYSKIGGWVTEWNWDPIKWRLPIPPKVSAQMDLTQIMAISATREALLDYGYPERPFDPERTAVILGNAMGGDQHLYTAGRIFCAEYEQQFIDTATFATLSEKQQKELVEQFRKNITDKYPEITEDTMPGELSNIAAGRIAALFNFRGPNYVADAACASAMAAMSAAIIGLERGDYDVLVTGGIDANMASSTFVKFCKIGALSATGTRPYAKGADGFVMGEGGAIFLMKRAEDAVRDGDKIYAILRSFGGSSDGKGKGITAPNPIGQKLAVKRAWENAGFSPETATMIEGHGTSTSVGDAVELQCLNEVFGEYNLKPGSISLGSVKSNIGHLKGAAGAAGMMKVVMSLHEKVLTPSLNFNQPNPSVDFSKSPFSVNTELRPWDTKKGQLRRAGLSAFGFGGTNFHAVLEEYDPNNDYAEPKTRVAFENDQNPSNPDRPVDLKKPLRGIYLKGGDDQVSLVNSLKKDLERAKNGWSPPIELPSKKEIEKEYRLTVDFTTAEELSDKLARAIKAIEADKPRMWKVLNTKGIFLGKGKPGKTAFLFTGQGSQYLNMLKELRATEKIVADTFDEADKVMTPLLDKPLTDYIFVDESNKEIAAEANEALKQTEITQPSVLTVDIALYRLMKAYGMNPDFVIGHSLGEYGALVASGIMTFRDALVAVSARGQAMSKIVVEDNGKMAAIFTSPENIEEVIKDVDGYIEIANINSFGQSVIGGASKAVEEGMQLAKEKGYHVAELPVSHAFHTKIVAPASGPLRDFLQTFNISRPTIPVVANIDAEFYPDSDNIKEDLIRILSQQVASPVQFVQGIEKLYDNGAKVFVEMGPKRALNGFVRDILGEKDDVTNLFTNHPKVGDVTSFNHTICGMYASGHGNTKSDKPAPTQKNETVANPPVTQNMVTQSEPVKVEQERRSYPSSANTGDINYEGLGKLFVDFLDKANNIVHKEDAAYKPRKDIWITGASLGLPGVDGVFRDDNVKKILEGEQFIKSIPEEIMSEMLDKNITRLIKTGSGGPRFVTIDNLEDVIKLAARKVNFDIVRDFDFPANRMPALDVVSCLAIGSGIDAMHDAGIPLVMDYKETTAGTRLWNRWLLPKEMRDDTGIIFTSAFPGYNAYAKDIKEYHEDKERREKLEIIANILNRLSSSETMLISDLKAQKAQLEKEIQENPFVFDRRFLFKVLAMGHSQFAEYIGARGPNTQINSACGSGSYAISIAKDWIEAGRCNRVIVVSADDITADDTLGWFASGFLASGAAATDRNVEDAALPFDKRRHGMIMGMGAAAVVLENKDSAQNRGLNPICSLVSSVMANSAFHGTRLDIDHIRLVMEKLIADAEKDWNIDRHQIAGETIFVSHETYTPARGGSAAAEINALRYVFGDSADKIMIANTKGFTGHPMAVGIEEVVAIKCLETGIIPPVPNIKEIDPDLGYLNLSKGGFYPAKYALRLGAGFGSQISMTLFRWYPTPDGNRPAPDRLGYTTRISDQKKWNAWLKSISMQDNPEIEVHKRTLRILDEVVKANGVKQEEKKQEPVLEAPVVVQPVKEEAVDPVKEEILNLVAQKTGYPAEMLDPTLDLEADLGIDTVKQAELFAEVREKYGIEREDNLQLSDFPTLNDITGFVYDKRPDLKKAQPTVVAEKTSLAAPVVTEAPKAEDNAVAANIIELIAKKTGYPSEMLDPDLDLEADLGIDTVKQAEFFAEIREEYGIERDDSMELSKFPTLQHIVQYVFDKRPDLKSKVATLKQTEPATHAVAVSAPTVIETSSTQPVATSDPVLEKILAMIADKTGYPTEMLDPELDLEADLGIDTVKQAEIFAEIRESYGIEREDSLELSEFPTLHHIVGFVYDRKPELKQVQPLVTATPVVQPAIQVETQTIDQLADSSDPVLEKILSMIAEKTGYPPEMLDPELDLEADLGIDTVKQAEIFAEIRESYGIEREDSLELSEFPTLKHIVGFVYDRKPELKQIIPTPTPQAPEVNQPVETSTLPAEGEDPVMVKILNLIAEKTGYPTDMLDPDLDLEADLGIDTVKQAEFFAEIREIYNIPRDDSMELSEFPTLRHIVGFVYDRMPADQKSGTIIATEDSTEIAESQTDLSNVIPRRVPYPMLRPALQFCNDTGIEIGKDSRILVVSDNGGVGKSLIASLKKKGADIFIPKMNVSPENFDKNLEKWITEGPVTGVYWLSGLDAEGWIPAMSEKDWSQLKNSRIKYLFRTMKKIVEQSEGNTFLISATRNGGVLGYEDAGAYSAFGGAIGGFTKAFKREQPESLAKVIDFAPSRKTSALANILLHETAKDNGAVEIGYKDDNRWTLGLKEEALSEEAVLSLNSDMTFLVTGAAGSITSAITADLAKASGGTFFLLDLTPKPDKDDAEINLFRSDKDSLKKQLFEKLKGEGKKPTPVMIERELSGIERKESALQTIEVIEAAGGKAHYLHVNLLDGKQVKTTVAKILKQTDRIDVLLHAAGLEISHLLKDKKPSEFDLVFDVKCDGWFHLMKALEKTEIGHIVGFSSIAGRFGNAGQTDYASANDFLCKSISSLKRFHQETRGIVIDWTAWGDIGMASRGSIPMIMKQAGIDMLPPDAGIDFIRQELTNGTGSTEVVAAQSLGVMLNEFSEDGGYDSDSFADIAEKLLMVDKITDAGIYKGYTTEVTLDPKEQPFLFDHQIGGKAVLPGVMGIEAMSQAASVLAPDYKVSTIANVSFKAPFKFYKDEPRKVYVIVKHERRDHMILAHCTLLGKRKLHGQDVEKVSEHFTAEVWLKPEFDVSPAPLKSKINRTKNNPLLVKKDIYKVYFHGPAYQVIEKSWKKKDDLIASFASKISGNHIPENLAMKAMPRLIEFCFQTAGIIELGSAGKMGLPSGISRVNIFDDIEEGSELKAVVSNENGQSDALIIDKKGNVLIEVSGYTTAELNSIQDEQLLKPLKKLFQ
jgi:malonyl CoA-acyl carrier protein transacylase